MTHWRNNKNARTAEEDKSALVLTAGMLHTLQAKTAHGLIRSSGRFNIVAVVDHTWAGKDAGLFVDGKARGIPVYATIKQALTNLPRRPRWCVVGIATHGGALTKELRALLLEAAGVGLSIVNGLHQYASDDPEIRAAARRSGARIVDVRRPKPKEELHFWRGEVYKLEAPRLAVLGMDCAIGKRTTASIIAEGAQRRGLRAELIYTGQTGWMLGWEYGIILDSLVNDFISGELEYALCKCERERSPDFMVIEGQSSLRNPCGPCGSEILLSGDVHGVVLQHAPLRSFFEGYEELKLRIPPVAEEVELIRFYGARTLCVTLNTSGIPPQEVPALCSRLTEQLGIPVLDPLNQADLLVDIVIRYVEAERSGDRNSRRGGR